MIRPGRAQIGSALAGAFAPFDLLGVFLVVEPGDVLFCRSPAGETFCDISFFSSVTNHKFGIEHFVHAQATAALYLVLMQVSASRFV